MHKGTLKKLLRLLCSDGNPGALVRQSYPKHLKKTLGAGQWEAAVQGLESCQTLALRIENTLLHHKAPVPCACNGNWFALWTLVQHRDCCSVPEQQVIGRESNCLLSSAPLTLPMSGFGTWILIRGMLYLWTTTLQPCGCDLELLGPQTPCHAPAAAMPFWGPTAHTHCCVPGELALEATTQCGMSCSQSPHPSIPLQRKSQWD
jgi:hypothetical protein